MRKLPIQSIDGMQRQFVYLFILHFAFYIFPFLFFLFELNFMALHCDTAEHIISRQSYTTNTYRMCACSKWQMVKEKYDKEKENAKKERHFYGNI